MPYSGAGTRARCEKPVDPPWSRDSAFTTFSINAKLRSWSTEIPRSGRTRTRRCSRGCAPGKRRRILITVYFNGGSMTAGQIAETFEHAWPTTTRHLQVLEDAGLLQHERKGRSRHYRIDCRRLELVRDWLAWFSKAPD